MNSTPASSLDEGPTVEDSHGQSRYVQRKDGKRDSDLLDSRIEWAIGYIGAMPVPIGGYELAYLDYVFDFISIWECNRLTD